ncbi:hypothetical protein [Aliikangiella coralliicola]|uniref:Glycoside-hydrolase family GH114 TIM-barrel domain-containing protein n=1 Tax=Aliikangiella coralliicola TaxID=2592383 RepID=A0A545TSR5_9GAMM|nr:hypothetical protein [Aliikangiella coralliicola]TQV80252.1 hypothetical protein FLL46_26410 [Aliikangiella coralliicola]
MKKFLGKFVTIIFVCLATLGITQAGVTPTSQPLNHLGVYLGMSTSQDVTMDYYCDDMNEPSGADLDCIIDQIIYSKANVYYYSFSDSHYSHWDLFDDFLAQLADRAPSVRVYANFRSHGITSLPFSVCQKDLSTCNYLGDGQWGAGALCNWRGGLQSDLDNCKMLDLRIWADKLAELKAKHSNLAGISLDDFDSELDANGINNLSEVAYGNGMHVDNHQYWTPSELLSVKYILNSVGMKLLVTAYYTNDLLLNDGFLQNYKWLSRWAFDGINFPVIYTSNGSWGYGDADDFSIQISKLRNQLPGLNIYTMLYATHYNYTMPPTTTQYVRQMAHRAISLTDGVTMYRLPSGLTEQDVPTFNVPEKRELIRTLFMCELKLWC